MATCAVHRACRVLAVCLGQILSIALLQALKLGPQGLQLSLHGFVTPIEVVDSLNRGPAACNQTRDHETGRCPEIGSHPFTIAVLPSI
jgi:hypothetical protein